MDDNRRYGYSNNPGIPSSCSSTEPYMSVIGTEEYQDPDPYKWIHSPSLHQQSSFPAYHPIDLGTTAQFISPMSPNYSYITTPPTSAGESAAAAASASASSVEAPPSPAEERRCRGKGILQPGGEAEPTRRRSASDVKKHSISEKRHRDKINNAMNDLFSLIPNSQGSKYTMLNAAIQYVKSLEYQLQESFLLQQQNQLRLESLQLQLKSQQYQYAVVQQQNRELQQQLQYASYFGSSPSVTHPPPPFP